MHVNHLQAPLNYLFVGVEPSFTAYFFTKDVVCNASFDSCRTIEVAKKKMTEVLYDVYVIEGEDQESLDLITDIRKKAPQSVIALIGNAPYEKGVIDFQLERPLAPQQIDQFSIFLQKKFHQKGELFHPELLNTDLPLVYIIDPDTTFLNLLEKIKNSFPFKLVLESDPKRALELLDSKEFCPDALVLSEVLGHGISPYAILEKEEKKQRVNPLISALILEKEDMKSRIDAVDKHIQYIFHKPLYAHTLLKSIQEMLEVKHRQNYKVLVLDDDVDFCSFVVDLLNGLGMDSKAIHDPSTLFSVLDDFKPQLLLLDLVLPDYDGMDLLRMLHSDVAYSDLNIVIITAEDESSTRLLAYSEKADDIIYKPIDPMLFQKRIMSFSEKQHLKLEVTGMSGMKQLTAAIHYCLQTPATNPAFLAVFEVDHLNDWVLAHNQVALKELLVSINHQLLLDLDFDQSCYQFDGFKYALIFENTDLETVKEKLSTLLNQLVKRESLSKIHFNAAITSISNAHGNAEKNLKYAEYSLNDGLEAVNLTVSSIPNDNLQKEVVLIDSDEQLLKILKNQFEYHGLAVTTFETGKSALSDLLNRTPVQLPALLIVERKLEDMDGMDIPIKLKTQFKLKVPFYILTYFASDKDVLDGVKCGALEYITKPFNTSILMEKALKTIFQTS